VWTTCASFMTSRILRPALLLVSLSFLSACSGPSYTYRHIPGRTAIVRDGLAYAPPAAPAEVHAAVAAGNEIAGSAYVHGGGHGGNASGFDCSGATSYVLRAAGLLEGSMPSRAFRRYGERGEGEWISVWARKGHVFLVVAGLRFDTGWNGNHSEGPRWTTRSRNGGSGCVIRHPRGF
jgi:hypothetical protein